jgi:UDP-2,3-diacylglucosamine hydrolase
MAKEPFVLSTHKELPNGKFLYFASDFHLGAPNKESSDLRERKIVAWMEEVSKDAAAIFLVGDLFDFWYEYKQVIPKGFVKFQACLATLRDRDIPIYFFTGNHDLWMFDYFPTNFGIPVFREPIIVEVGEQRIYLGHGDGLGPGDHFYKLLKRVFEAKLSHWLFKWIHPDIGVWLALKWSRSSRISSTERDGGYQTNEKEWLWQYAREISQSAHFDYFIFGHRHLPLELEVNEKSKYINLGEWVNHCTYVKYDGAQAQLLTYSS